MPKETQAKNLYHAIYLQKLRFDHFDRVSQRSVNLRQPNNNMPWLENIRSLNTIASHEEIILNQLLQLYKNCYLEELDALLKHLETTHIDIINSFFTTNRDYYVKQHEQNLKNISNHKVKISSITADDVLNVDLSELCVINAEAFLPRIDLIYQYVPEKEQSDNEEYSEGDDLNKAEEIIVDTEKTKVSIKNTKTDQ